MSIKKFTVKIERLKNTSLKRGETFIPPLTRFVVVVSNALPLEHRLNSEETA